MKDSDTALVALMISAVVIAIATAGGISERAEAETEHARYCEMTAIFKDTSGEFGWPAYKPGIDCEADAAEAARKVLAGGMSSMGRLRG